MPSLQRIFLPTSLVLQILSYLCAVNAIPTFRPRPERLPSLFSAPLTTQATFPPLLSATTISPFVIDTFQEKDSNDLGFWHGPGEDLRLVYGYGEERTDSTLVFGGDAVTTTTTTGLPAASVTTTNMTATSFNSYVRFFPTDPDQNYHTQLSQTGCFNLSPYRDMGMLLHVVYSGTTKFSITLNQNNDHCNHRRVPYPESWDSVQADRYLVGGSGREIKEVFIPLSHFRINHGRILSVSFSGFYTAEPATLYKVEIVDSHALRGRRIPDKLPTGSMVLKCTRPNSFAFGIDDGQPRFAQEVMRILDDEGIHVTFFVVGAGLRDQEANFTELYKEMSEKGHQIALHSYSHPKLEGLRSTADIDREIQGSILALKETLGIECTSSRSTSHSFITDHCCVARYFRPPFGTIGARSRQRLAALLEDPYIVNWSVDIEDWLWANSPTPEKQLEAFVRGINRGGNLAVLHYLHPTTVSYLRDIIRFVKSTGMDIMRVDQCLEDPDSPPL